MPARVRTYAPRGQTPVLKSWQSYDHVSVMSGLTLAAQLYTRTCDRALRSTDSVAFLSHLHQQLGCPLLVIWDGSPIHRGVVIDFVQQEAEAYIQLESLPAYAPELNPTEGVWQHLKDVELRNLTCANLAALHHELHLAIMRLRSKPRLLQACFARAGLSCKT